MNETLRGFSRAMYSNWLWHKPLQLIIDAGEGLQLALGTQVFAPSHLAITHGHSDHVLGLPGFVAARRFGKGAVDKPLTIYYPEGSRGVDAVKRLLHDAYPGVNFPLTWTVLSPGTSVSFGKSRALEAFAVTHTPGEPALGYRVVERRQRLKPEYAHLPQKDIEALARAGKRDELRDEIRHTIFAHSGDAMPIRPSDVSGADLLVHDATFLDERDRREPIHATTREAFGVARDAAVGALILQHLSVRYDRATTLSVLRDQLSASGFNGACSWLDEDTFIDLRGDRSDP